jgi:hypothetical protein
MTSKLLSSAAPKALAPLAEQAVGLEPQPADLPADSEALLPRVAVEPVALPCKLNGNVASISKMKFLIFKCLPVPQ